MNDDVTSAISGTAPAAASGSAAARLTLRNWLGFLVGSRRAILTVSDSRRALWLGLLFTLSAGFPREYDGVYLFRESWHLLLPLVASLTTSALLLLLIYLPTGIYRDLWHGYRTLLTFFWMTAPLAWLYAIPVERFLDPVSATGANLVLLAIVSVWRVLLISRALSVWLDARFLGMLAVTLFFGLSVALVLTFLTPTPIWDIMGGIRLPEREQFILNVKHSVYFFGSIAWFISGVIATGILLSRSKASPVPPVRPSASTRVGAPLWGLAGVMFLAGIALAFVAQDEQRHRWEAERMLRGGALTEGLRYIAARPREVFPPHWDLPPRTAYGETEPAMADILSALTEIDAPHWMWDVYLSKLLAQYSGLADAIEMAEAGEPAILFRVLEFVERHGATGEFAYSLNDRLREAAASEEIDPDVRTRINEFLARGPAAAAPAP